MLDPKARRVLLPQDREIIAITGMTEDEYIQFLDYCAEKSRFEPGQIVALEPFTIILINLAIGLLLTGASMLLAPKPQEPKTTELDESTVDGQDIVRGGRFAPKAGFDNVQNVVEIGSVVPIVYAKRENIDGNQYGGIRINTNLLWSQLQSIGGGQFFRGLFMVGEATNDENVADGPVIDFEQTAFGNNTLGAYYLDENQTAGRATIYYSPGNGRIEGGTLTEPGNFYQIGILPPNDPGNKEENTPAGADVYCIESNTETPTKDFCQAIIPSNQSEFGLYSFIGNRFGFKLGERFEPVTQWQNRSDGEYERQDSNQKVAQNKKDRAMFSTRAGFFISNSATEGETTLSKGDTIQYRIYRSSDKDQIFESNNSSSGGEEASEVSSDDVASTISSLQRGYDESINVGDLYKAGSALLICTARSTSPFESEADGNGAGTTVTHTFQCIEGGTVNQWRENNLERGPYFTNDHYDQNPEYRAKNATETSHMMRCSIASFTLERAAKTIEIGFKSRLGIKSNGIANFNSLKIPDAYQGEYSKYQEYIDSEFCGGQEDGDDPQENAYRKEIIAGRYTSFDDRYSFFKIQYRDADQTTYTTISECFGIRSQTSKDVYNFIRLRFSSAKRRELRFIPLSGWEIRNSKAMGAGALMLLDPHVDNKVTRTSGDVELIFNGIEGLNRSSAVLGINAFANLNTGITDGLDIGQSSLTLNDPGFYYGNQTNVAASLVVHPNGSTTGRRAKVRVSTGGMSQGVTSWTVTRSGEDYSVGDSLTLSLSDMGLGSGVPAGYQARWTVTSVGDSAREPIGYAPEDDGAYYVDAYARLAEAFTYNDVTNSASQPEHTISYVNIIEENPSTPEYDNLAILGLNIRSTKEIRQLDQVSVYVQRGVIDSHLFPDVFKDLLMNRVYGVGGFFDRAQIDEDSFADAATFTQGRRYFYDGAISEKLNLRSWGSDMASNFLLDLGISGGKFTLNPVVNFTGPETIRALMTAGNIIEDSFEANYFDSKDRLLPRVSVKWREERQSLSLTDRGLFPQVREVLVSRVDSGESPPDEAIDMSAFCTNENHAIERAKWLCQQRKHITHSIRFKTLPSEASFQVGSVIKVAVEAVSYQPATNGAISSNGTVTSWPNLDDGDHDVLLWNGDTLSEQTIRVVNQQTTDAVSSVFCLKDSDNKAEGYKVQSIAFDDDGNIDVTAIYWPLDENDHSKLKEDFGDAFFTIER